MLGCEMYFTSVILFCKNNSVVSVFHALQFFNRKLLRITVQNKKFRTVVKKQKSIRIYYLKGLRGTFQQGCSHS